MSSMNIETPLKRILNTNDNAEFSFEVKLVYSQSKVKDGLLLLVSHISDNTPPKSCLLFIEKSSLTSDSPKILQIIPISSNLKIETAQYNSSIQKGDNTDPVVTFSVGQVSAGVIFFNADNMSKAISEIENQKSITDSNKHNPRDIAHEWTDYYKQYYDHRTTTKSHSLPVITRTINSANSLRYVLPIERAETLASINLKRTRSVAKPKQRLINYKAATEHYVNAQLVEKESSFVNWEKTTAFVGTWNVHESLPDETLKMWLQDTLKTEDGTDVDPDFYVIGLQEIDQSAQSYVWYNPTIQNTWVAKILDSLNDSGEERYYKVEAKQLVTILLIVIAKKSHQPHISEISSNYVGIGALNMAGNKGGVGVRLRFHDSYLCFVTSHLAAFMNQIDKRNQDFASITKRLFFPIKGNKQDSRINYVSHYWNDGGDEGISFIERQNITKDWSKEASVFHSDILIWCGDLNYRVNYLKQDKIIKMVGEEKIDELLQYDQLSIERSAGRTFQMFDEGQITFSPTYKYDAGTDNYDSSKKKREPSWTDRILWKKDRENASNQSVELLSYTNCMEMKLSDHKPVRALMKFNIRHIDEQRQKNIREDIVKTLKNQQDYSPQGRISSSFVDFQNVQFMAYKEKSITLENPGNVVVPYRFLSNENTDADLPPWLHISPLSGVLPPNEKVVIHFEILVDPTNSAPLNGQNQKIDELLLLRVEKYKDFYVNVCGQYEPTCFGALLEDLAIEEGENGTNLPAQLTKIISYLSNNNVYEMESLFLDHGLLDVSTYIRQWLDEEELESKEQSVSTYIKRCIVDEGKPKYLSNDVKNTLYEFFDDNDQIDEKILILSMTDVLVAFLECLPEPIIPVSMYQEALEAAETSAMTNFIEKLSPLRKNVLVYVSQFLKNCILQAPEAVKEKRQKEIVKRFTVLLRPPVDFKERNPVKAEEKLHAVLTQLLK